MVRKTKAFKRVLGGLIFSVGLICTGVNAMELSFEIGDRSFKQSFPDSEATERLAEVLPVTLSFEDYGSTERIAYLPQKLNVSSNVSHNPQRGDLTYYVPWGNLAVFVKDFRHSQGLMYIGSLDEELLQAIKSSGEQQVTIKVVP